MAYLIDFEGPSLSKLPEDAAVRSVVSVGDNAELVENNVRYNPETKGWRLTLRLKLNDPSKSTELRASLVQDVVAAPATKPAAQMTKAEKAAAKQHEKKEQKAKDAQTSDAQATPTTPEPVKTEKVLTETWSYQLPADE